uniref:Peptidase S1 domain-containing protein n=1 Tax=Macrostomum lignano TaxID=282301 RepID=A0A1I8IE61_9PLAT
GFEDCIILDDLMQQFGHDFGKVLPAFTNSRVEDAHAIVDLALYNYIEMRQSVNSVTFLLRKKLDNALNWLLPNHWVPLYTMVTFSRTPYSRAITDRRWQDRVLGRLLCAAAVAASVCAACAAHRLLSGAAHRKCPDLRSGLGSVKRSTTEKKENQTADTKPPTAILAPAGAEAPSPEILAGAAEAPSSKMLVGCGGAFIRDADRCNKGTIIRDAGMCSKGAFIRDAGRCSKGAIIRDSGRCRGAIPAALSYEKN